MAASSSPILPPVAVALINEVVAADARAELIDNVDRMRFPDGPVEVSSEQAVRTLAELLGYSSGLQRLFDDLAEPADRELLTRILAFRVLGHRKVSLPLTAERLRALEAQAYTARRAANVAPMGINGWYADEYDLSELGYPIRLQSFVGGVLYTFQLEQYRCPGALEVGVRPGDVVIDGGAYWGETALYFAHLAGRTGRVVSFEFEAHNIERLRVNLGLNPELAPRIQLVPAALWDRAGQTVSFMPQGPGTVIAAGGEGMATTDTIDALVGRGVVPRVDFIKMDIEGAELNALRGAESTLRRFRPRLAIAAYHKLDDLSAIPAYLSGLDLGYRFRLAHTTMHAEETVLFATADNGEGGPVPQVKGIARRLAARRRQR